MALLEVEDLHHAYDDRVVVRGVSFALERGAIGCLLGPSGCGKTTVLRCIAGFETVQHGAIRLAGQTVSAPGTLVPPEARRIGMVFQDYALFPHLTVADNIGFGLHRLAREEHALRIQELGRLVRLAEELDQYPHEISGGQQQRVALARALVNRPAVLLADEPTGNLDTQSTREVLGLLRRHHERGQTIVLVTHDARVASAADRVIHMRDGVISEETRLSGDRDPAALASQLVRLEV